MNYRLKRWYLRHSVIFVRTWTPGEGGLQQWAALPNRGSTEAGVGDSVTAFSVYIGEVSRDGLRDLYWHFPVDPRFRRVPTFRRKPARPPASFHPAGGLHPYLSTTNASFPIIMRGEICVGSATLLS